MLDRIIYDYSIVICIFIYIHFLLFPLPQLDLLLPFLKSAPGLSEPCPEAFILTIVNTYIGLTILTHPLRPINALNLASLKIPARLLSLDPLYRPQGTYWLSMDLCHGSVTNFINSSTQAF